MHTIRISRVPTTLLACAALVLAAGCASANKRLEQGAALEQQGRPADAARRYIDALKKDRTLAEARARLQDTGDRAVADYLREADADVAAGRATDAADALGQLESLRADASAVGVQLATPADYASRRQDVLGRAVDQALAEASGAQQRQDYASAVRWLDRAATRWQPAPEQLARIDRARFDTHLAWAQGEMSAGRYRSAYEHAGTAAGLRGIDAATAADLQREALRRGTVRVAVFPVGAPRRADQGVRDRVLPELNDALALNFWQRPPLWLDVINPLEAARLARQRGHYNDEIEPYDAQRMAQYLGARIAVVASLDSVRRTEENVQTVRHPARTRAGVDTAYTTREGDAQTWARVSYRVVDAAGFGGSSYDSGDVTARSNAHFRRATYAGNWRDLALTSSEASLFERGDDAGYNRETVRELADGLSGRLGREVFDALLRRVP
jgi:hypothetical protein